jgi:hypothetical protein
MVADGQGTARIGRLAAFYVAEWANPHGRVCGAIVGLGANVIAAIHNLIAFKLKLSAITSA